MAYEFKKLSDVVAVETPADTANVLIEEDGVIKKAPKSAVGGAGGIEVTSIAEVGQTIIVKAVDENGKPTEWECADKVSSWDDLEDKPFYEGIGKIVIIPETVGTVDYSGFPRIIYDYTQLDWTLGNTLFIKWDGVEYEAVCKENSDGLFEYSFKVDGEHSVEFWDNGAIYNEGGTGRYLVDGDTHTYEVYAYGETVIPLDEKYIPNSIKGGIYDVLFTCSFSQGSLNNLMKLRGDYGSLRAKFDANIPILARVVKSSFMDDVNTRELATCDIKMIQLVNNELVFKTDHYGDWFYLRPDNTMYYEEHLD